MTITNDNLHPESPERRELLRQGAALGALGLAGAGNWWSQSALAADETLVPFSDMPDPYIAPPVTPGATHYLDRRGIDARYTNNNDFYIVQHYNQPTVDASGYKLRVTGLVNKPLELDLATIKRRPKVELEAGFECGGNSPRLFQGLIGNARWVGTPLKGLLDEAGVKPDGIEVVCYGHDKGEETIREVKVEQNFGRSLHISDAMNPDVLLVWEMNGEPLPFYHGAPLRLLVPGWYGVANVKWLSQIHIQEDAYLGKYQARWYRTVRGEMIDGEMKYMETAVTHMNPTPHT